MTKSTKPKLRPYFFPKDGITVSAVSYEEAQDIYEKLRPRLHAENKKKEEEKKEPPKGSGKPEDKAPEPEDKKVKKEKKQ